MTQKNILLLLILIGIQSCDLKTKDQSIISIDMKQATENNIAFNESYNTMLVSSFKNKYPKYYYNQLKSNGVSEADSIIISTLNTDYRKFKYELFKNGFVENYKKLKIDSISEKTKPNQKQLIVAISFKKGKQILTVDANSNNNFLDDKSIEFNEDFRLQANDTNRISSLPFYMFNFWNKKNDIITEFNRKIIIYPHSNYPNFGYSNDEFENKSRLIVKFKDYWLGDFSFKNENYNVAIQGGNSSYLTILIKPNNLKFSSSNIFYNDNFAYKIKDTINISNQLFVIDSITNDISMLTLRSIKSHPDTFFGNKIGYKLANFLIEDLNDSKFNINSIVTNGNKYTLLDFWGTWCKPCTELTPKLKQLNKDFSKDLKIIGVALDKNKEVVKDYVQKNDMDWNQGFVDRKNRKGSIINKLRITSYPTFILIDKNRKIIYRGVGEVALKEIKNIIKKSLSIK